MNRYVVVTVKDGSICTSLKKKYRASIIVRTKPSECDRFSSVWQSHSSNPFMKKVKCDYDEGFLNEIL